jgi:hypothetical protein
MCGVVFFEHYFKFKKMSVIPSKIGQRPYCESNGRVAHRVHRLWDF